MGLSKSLKKARIGNAKLKYRQLIIYRQQSPNLSKTTSPETTQVIFLKHQQKVKQPFRIQPAMTAVNCNFNMEYWRECGNTTLDLSSFENT